ncbi:2'-deoxynucleoside 5'-phosphate N-hydrolase 1-like [Scleropages formosus]|uniref:2'-deoxynucleoside 5'-phosphate N-hydrolase 1 n=1 Tax=Scleropages formosus TaxID=113540 RepID=A0A0P7ZA08_SCLFO|nr:2'-deoxynucleoside 5'-phosphate N-hydrolase 1-like [Scleropages formosus]
MRIYFCGSIRGGRQDVALYQRIVRKLQELGQVLTEHVSRSDISEKGEDAAALEDKAIHDRDVQWLHAADVVVAEVTQPSLGVGYELGRAVAMRKRILCLFRPSSGRGSVLLNLLATCVLIDDFWLSFIQRVLFKQFHYRSGFTFRSAIIAMITPTV